MNNQTDSLNYFYDIENTIIHKDEASIIKVNNFLSLIDGTSLNYAIESALMSAELDMYCFIIIPSREMIISGRSGIITYFHDYPPYLIESLKHINRHTTWGGNFVHYIWKSKPLDVDYLKRSYVIRLTIEYDEVIIGTGYPIKIIGK